MKMNTSSRVAFEARQSRESPRELWGIIGGMGPLASAEFMKTIYEFGEKRPEQEMPAVVLLSDPSVPDRTECFVNGLSHLLIERLENSIRHLVRLNVTHIVICCLTIHRVLPMVQGNLKRTILSLVELVLSAVIQSDRRHLLLCTSGARAMQLFESHELWRKASRNIVMPSSIDQQAVHKLIYRIKGKYEDRNEIEFLWTLADRYHAEVLIAGCTELHILARAASNLPEDKIQWLDPLLIAAARIAQGHTPIQAAGPSPVAIAR
jgi:aspartate racemase